MTDLSNDIEKMKEKMKVESLERKALNDSTPTSTSSNGTKGSKAEGENDDKKPTKPVPRDPAESLKMMLTDDGVDAVRPSSDAEEQIKKMERQVRLKMKTEREKMMKEQQRLLEIQHELDLLEVPMKRDVALTRDRLEILDRELATCEKDHSRKKKEYEEAKSLLEKKRQEKLNLADHLRMIIHDNEQRKTAKLEELMSKLGVVTDEEKQVFEGFS